MLRMLVTGDGTFAGTADDEAMTCHDGDDGHAVRVDGLTYRIVF